MVPALRRARYRAWQFMHGLRPSLAPREIEDARAHLSPPEFALFLDAEARDRRHSVDLFEALRAAGAGKSELVAALVHDVGKGRIRTWHRVAFVLLRTTPLAGRLEVEAGAPWQQALWRLRHHARLGAERLEVAGSDERVVELVHRHTDAPPADDAALARFIEFDDRL